MSTRRLLQQNNGGGPSVPYQLATPGNTAPLGAPTFTRADAATCAMQLSSAGLYGTVLANVLRDAHYVGGIRTILLEESRSNPITQASNLADAGTWAKTRASALQNATGPDGVASSASTLTEDNTATATHSANRNTSVSITANTPQSMSMLLHSNGRFRGRIPMFVGADFMGVEFNLNAVTVTNAIAGTGSVTSARIYATSGGWFRAEIIGIVSSTGVTGAIELDLEDASGNRVYSGDNASGLQYYAVQHEVNKAFPTSPINSVGSTLTRAVDALSLAGVNITGTLFFHFWDLATWAWADATAVYTANTAIVPPVNRAYSHMAVIQGTQTAAQCKAILGGFFP